MFLGIKFKNRTKHQICDLISNILHNKPQRKMVVTVNPEMILFASKNRKYQKIINQADLRVVDGFGVKLWAWLKNRQVGDRITGVDLAEQVLKTSLNLNLKIVLVIKRGGLSKKSDFAENNFELKQVTIFYQDEFERKLRRGDHSVTILEVLLVGLGVPAQEELIVKSKKYLPKLRLAMGVGGTFDFWTKKKKRVPYFLRRIGLEWLWRLLVHPKGSNVFSRIKKIWHSVVSFSWLALWGK